MQAHKTILRLKYANVIKTYSEKYNVPLREALAVFMMSEVYQWMSQGIADYHCRSDLYIAEDLHNEWLEKQKR